MPAGPVAQAIGRRRPSARGAALSARHVALPSTPRSVQRRVWLSDARISCTEILGSGHCKGMSMPKIVHHDERRAEIIRATWRVIAREGIANATTREIAKEAGYSYGVLAHYFIDKADVLASALVASHRNVRSRIDARNKRITGLPALRALMLECLPLDEQRVLEAKVEVSFWGQAVGNSELVKIQNAEVDGLWERIRQRLVEADQEGQLRLGLDIDLAVHSCVALIDSLSLRAVLYPARTANEDQITMLDALFALITHPDREAST
jgi:AcrR family transcriptional regulator